MNPQLNAASDEFDRTLPEHCPQRGGEFVKEAGLKAE
jgi:hypothetical protein